MRRTWRPLPFFLVLIAAAAAGRAQQAGPPPSELEIADQARMAILCLPDYGVFDLIAFGVHGTTVTLGGDADRAALKHEAEEAIRKIPGVTEVINKIEVLPVFSKTIASGWSSSAGPLPMTFCRSTTARFPV